jgi:hypothetical protein
LITAKGIVAALLKTSSRSGEIWVCGCVRDLAVRLSETEIKATKCVSACAGLLQELRSASVITRHPSPIGVQDPEFVAVGYITSVTPLFVKLSGTRKVLYNTLTIGVHRSERTARSRVS